MDSISVKLNGEDKFLETNVSVSDLLKAQGFADSRVAVELNKTVVRRKDWAETYISKGDVIEIVHFVGGG